MTWDSEEWKIVGFGALAMLAIAAITVAVSAPSHETVAAPDGRAAILVTCSSPGGCISESSKACPSGYHVLSADAERGTVTTYTNVATGNGQSVGVPVTSDTYSGATLIRCGAVQ